MEHQKLLMQARLIKLRKDEEKANKRINDDMKQSDFTEKLHLQKQLKRQEQYDLMMRHKLNEEMNRNKIHNHKEMNKNQIELSKKMKFDYNHD